jgi:hypothetical protein
MSRSRHESHALNGWSPVVRPQRDSLGNVAQPTITVHLPKGKNTGAAVVVSEEG